MLVSEAGSGGLVSSCLYTNVTRNSSMRELRQREKSYLIGRQPDDRITRQVCSNYIG